MKLFTICVLSIFTFPLSGCGDNAMHGKSKSTSPVAKETELTLEEKFSQTMQKAEAGDASAQSSLGEMYDHGKGTAKNKAIAFEWYKKSADQGNTKGQANLGWWLYTEAGDAEKALVLLQKSADQGEVLAQSLLGEIYSRNERVVNNAMIKNTYKDISKAIAWHLKAAEQGYPFSMRALGYIYKVGDGVKIDLTKSNEWYRKSFEIFQRDINQGDVDIQRALASAYFYGNGVVKNDQKAIELNEKIAMQGGAEDQANLADKFLGGYGVPKNFAKAFEWYKKAAEQGSVNAEYHLGRLYAEGEGTSKDITKAFELYLKAAAQGHSTSQYMVSYIYGDPNGISPDLVREYAWFNLAMASENDPSIVEENRIKRYQLEKRMTLAQRTEGQRLAANWKMGDTLLASVGIAPSTESFNNKYRKHSTGTAFSVSREGHALTNHHVINGCAEVKVAGREGKVKVIASDSVNDIALLQLPGNLKDVANLNPDLGKLRQGEDIIVFGFPLNYVLSSGGNLTPGVISALTGLGNNTNQIQITAPIQPGSSGSPVMDKKGNIVGVVSMKLDDGRMAKATGQVGQNVNFAVNGQTVKSFLDTNKVPYKTGGGFFSQEKSNADIAEEASKWTVLVECWK